MPRARPATDPVIPGETANPITEDTAGADLAAPDAFQAIATGGDADLSEGLDENSTLRALVASQARHMEAMRVQMEQQAAAISNLARNQAGPASQVATEDALPDMADVDLEKYYAGNNTTPILTKQGWLTHPRQGWIPNAPKL